MSVLRRLPSGVHSIASGAFFWNALGAVVLALLLARWTWVWFAPHTPSVLPVAERATAGEAERLFGVSVVATEQAAPLANLNLIGVYTGPNGFAVFEVDGKRQVGVPIGGEISPGVKLLETASDHVFVGAGGARQRVDLKGGSNVGAPAGTPAGDDVPGGKSSEAAGGHVTADKNGVQERIDLKRLRQSIKGGRG